ncbi:hypothetical protein QUF80_14090 [Desulfococcaceae bacterium HSG8]|nr:hypothetical protein [Desulfococcaceae bacterium HSG8]
MYLLRITHHASRITHYALRITHYASLFTCLNYLTKITPKNLWFWTTSLSNS